MQFLGIIFILMLIVSQDPTKVKTHYAPFNLLSLLSQSLSSKEKFPDTLPFTQNAFTLTGKQAGNLNVVLVIGESARADHFHLNGYARDTTPNLDKRANLVSFKDVTSCGNVTMDSVPCMLIRVGKADFNQQQRHQSFITVLKQLGFDTIWLANQGSFALLDDYINNIAGEAELVLMPGRDLLLANKLDENILPYLDDYLNKHLGNNLIIIHSQGSHHSYDARYSEPFRMFTPTAGNNIFKNNLKKIARENIINSYDNSILYTDYFLNEVIKRFDHKNALFIYVSDHGESLGENGNYLHGYDESPAQYHVPMIMWLSDLFISDHPGVLTKLRQKLEAKLSHDNLFHTVLDCAGVESQLVNKTLSLCQ